MNYKKYSQAIWQSYTTDSKSEFNNFLEGFFKLLKKKNELSLLPKIYSEIENIINREQKSEKTTIILKNKDLLKDYTEKLENFKDKFNINDLEVKENENIIGGFILKNKKYLVNNSYKNKLIKLYKKILS